MTRSFGDEVASRVGVTAEPEILELDLCKEDKFIVLASDGVWEFLTNDKIANIVAPFFEVKNAEKAAEAVVRESYLRWKKEEEGIVDDPVVDEELVDLEVRLLPRRLDLLNKPRCLPERVEVEGIEVQRDAE